MAKIIIDGYSARMTESMMGREGLAYYGIVRRDGKKVGTFHNDGDGGADYFYFESKEEEKAFYEAVERNAPKTWTIEGRTMPVFERDARFLDMLLGS